MSDELTSEQDDAVRRLLREARHTEPIPSEVAARLDAALADLGAAPAEPTEPTEPTEPAPVVDLAAARKRRRNAGRVLLAAAAVIVVGVGVGQVIGTDSTSDDSSAGGSTAAQEPPDRGQSSDAEAAPAPDALAKQVPLQLSGDDLGQQVETQLSELPSDVRSETLSDEAPALTDPSFSCQTSVSTEDGTRVVPAYVDGAAALLALTPSQVGDLSGPQAGRLLDCATGDELAAFTVTLP